MIDAEVADTQVNCASFKSSPELDAAATVAGDRPRAAIARGTASLVADVSDNGTPTARDWLEAGYGVRGRGKKFNSSPSFDAATAAETAGREPLAASAGCVESTVVEEAAEWAATAKDGPKTSADPRGLEGDIATREGGTESSDTAEAVGEESRAAIVDGGAATARDGPKGLPWGDVNRDSNATP